jgi:hypothetical protein
MDFLYSPDGSGNFLKQTGIFFLLQKSDQRKLFLELRKKPGCKKNCSKKQD